MKNVVFLGSSLKDLRSFPNEARREAGYQLDRLQNGMEPVDWKSIKTIGAGVREIRIHADGAFRVLYVAKFEEAIYVLHAFQKKTQQTAQQDIDLGRLRYQFMLTLRKS